MNNHTGHQILKAAREKCDQLAQPLQRHFLLQQLWKDVRHNAGILKAAEDAVRMAPSREAAKATIQEDDIFEIRAVIIKSFIDVDYRAAADEELKTGADCIVEKNLKELSACTSMHGLYESTEAFVCKHKRTFKQ